TKLEHRNLPERHDRHFLDPATSERRQSTNNVTETGGPPEVVPSLAERWSHPSGGTQLKVVPCSWRATRWDSPDDSQRFGPHQRVRGLRTNGGCLPCQRRSKTARFWPVENCAV